MKLTRRQLKKLVENYLNEQEALGAEMLRQAAEQTGEAVGDGTSTSTVIAHEIFSQGIRNVVAGASAVDVKRGLERGLDVAVDSLRELSRPVKSTLERAQVATISAHNNAVIGQLVADAMERVGDDGVITVESRYGRTKNRLHNAWPSPYSDSEQEVGSPKCVARFAETRTPR